MRTLKFTGALHEGEGSGGSACAEGGGWSVGNAATGCSRAWRAWCCVEWRERREERSEVTGASDGIKRRHCAGFAIALCRSDCPKPHPRTQRKRRTQRPERNTATTARHSHKSPKRRDWNATCPACSHVCRRGKTNDYLDTRDKHLNIGAHCRDCGWAVLVLDH